MKSLDAQLVGKSLLVAPFAGAWIEIAFAFKPSVADPKSLPSRERGLKYSRYTNEEIATLSLPSRERGLKSWRKGAEIRNNTVAPFAGAWIEISEVL